MQSACDVGQYLLACVDSLKMDIFVASIEHDGRRRSRESARLRFTQPGLDDYQL